MVRTLAQWDTILTEYSDDESEAARDMQLFEEAMQGASAQPDAAFDTASSVDAADAEPVKSPVSAEAAIDTDDPLRTPASAGQVADRRGQ